MDDEQHGGGCIVRLVPYNLMPEDQTIWERELVEGELPDGTCRFYSTGSCQVGYKAMPQGQVPIVENLFIEIDAVSISEAALMLPHRLAEEATAACRAFKEKLAAAQHQITDAAGIPYHRGANQRGG